MESLLIVATNAVHAVNDKQQVAPMLRALEPVAEILGKPKALVADTGFCSEANAGLCTACEITPCIAVQWEEHHRDPDPIARYTQPPPLKDDATPLEVMCHTLQTMAWRALYGLRKCTVEPVIGIIKLVMGFRHFSLRGLASVSVELSLVALAWNLKRMFVLNPEFSLDSKPKVRMQA